MLYLFFGDDVKRKISASEQLIKSLPKGTEIFRLHPRDFDSNQIESFYSGAGLFFNRSVIIFSNFLETEETRSFILDKLSNFASSPNSFVFLEGRLAKAVTDSFKKARAEVGFFELPKEKDESLNSFVLANAFGMRDKLSSWIYFRQLIDKGAEVDALSGMLFWKVKDMILKKNFSKFTEAELKNLAKRISTLLPEARVSGHDAELRFEQFILETL